MTTRHAYYKGLLHEGPIFQLVKDAVGIIDDGWHSASATCQKTIRAAAAGGLFSKSYPENEMVGAMLDPNLDTLSGLTRKQRALVQFFVELCQYRGQSLHFAQVNPHSLSDERKTQLLIRLSAYVEKREIRKYAVIYEQAMKGAVAEIMGLCVDTDLFTPSRGCSRQEAMNVFKTDVMVGLAPAWGKFKNVRPVTRQALPAFYKVLDNWT